MKKMKTKNVGNYIQHGNASWSFDGKTAKNFDKHIKQSIPMYDTMHELALKISDFFLTEKSNIYDLGCSTGTFINLLQKRHLHQ